MLLALEQDEALDPVDVGFLGAKYRKSPVFSLHLKALGIRLDPSHDLRQSCCGSRLSGGDDPLWTVEAPQNRHVFG